ncbi:MAG: hypothetical protein JWP88_412 [Flaviaesturariibacter sp.]|nr:hypothetical protein [Flaviaesturariibacter sp.]
MSLNGIRLSPQLLSDLYGNVLVETVAKPVPASAPVYPVSYLGMNEKSILIVTAEPEAKYIEEGELKFLTAILGACGLGLADVAIVNWLNTEKNYGKLIEALGSKTVLLFDVEPETFGLPMNFPPFQIQSFAGRTYIYSPALKVIEGDIPLKKQLWAALKQTFCV